jgi:hypothetical protein
MDSNDTKPEDAHATADKSKAEAYDEAHGPGSDERAGDTLEGPLTTTAIPAGGGGTVDGGETDRPVRAAETEDARTGDRHVEPNAEPDAVTDQPTRGTLSEANHFGATNANGAKSVSAAPPRPHDQLVSQLAMYWAELQAYAATIKGDVDGHLGELLNFVRERS